jgi:cell wall-associated NlpC family hydrolase
MFPRPVFARNRTEQRLEPSIRRQVRNPLACAFGVLLLAVCAAAGNRGRPTPGDELVVALPVANMYSSATESTDVVSQAILGSEVVVLEVKNKKKWAKVRTPDQYTGWMPISELRKWTGEKPYGSQGHTVQVESLFANLYRDRDVTQHRPLLTVPFETHLEPIADRTDEEGRWMQVILPDRRTAWIQRSDVNPGPKPLTIEQSIDLAKRFLGLPYLWGGRSSYGYDCSGFTQMLLRSRGINMPRDADLQAAWEGAEVVGREDLRAGDLLFFGASPDKVTHTGMYIGGGEFIHDTTHGHPVVQISRLEEEPWTRILVACRRVKAERN